MNFESKPKNIAQSPVWELTRYTDINTIHERAVELAEAIADSDDEVKKESLRAEYRGYLIVLNEALLNSVNRLADDLAFQEEYDLVQHRTSGESLAEVIKSGVRTPEVDVRTTKDGQTIIAHALKAKKGILDKGSKINEKTLEELKRQYPDITTTRESLDFFRAFSKDHELILELKDIESVEEVAGLIEEFELQDSIRIASLSASILEAMHQRLPNLKGFILNGGVVPFITAPVIEKPEDVKKSKLEKFVLNDGQGWKAAEIGPLRLVFCADAFPSADEAKQAGEGYGKLMAHTFFRIPDKLKELLKGDKSSISLSAVVIAANIISVVAPGTAREMIKSYQAMADKLGLKTMATTWLEQMGTVIKPLKAERQAEILKELGVDTIYTGDALEVTRKLRK